EGERRVRGKGHGQRQLLVLRTQAVVGLAEGHDPEDLAVGSLEGNEELVVRVPTLRAVHDRLAVWDEANARVRRPVEAVVWNEVRPGAQEPRMKERRPAVPVIDVAEQRLAHGRAAEHGLHVEVGPFGPLAGEDYCIE